MTFHLQGPAGQLEALRDVPAGAPRAAVVLAHPHPDFGGTMRTRVVHEAAQGLVRAGCAVLRFNYRGVGLSAGRLTGGAGEVKDFLAAIDAVELAHPGVALWAAGYSFGAWVAMATGAAEPRVRVLIGIGTPFGDYDFSRVAASEKPKFLVHGERDEVCPLKIVRQQYAAMAEPRELVVVEGAGHAFDGRAGEVGDALCELLEDFTA
jgi:alpha/beta superfamily hydrolase